MDAAWERHAMCESAFNGMEERYLVIYLLFKMHYNWLIMVSGDFAEYWLKSSC